MLICFELLASTVLAALLSSLLAQGNRSVAGLGDLKNTQA